MTIHIEALTFDAIIGLLDFERDRPQKVVVDLEADYDYQDAFLDYAQIAALIETDITAKRYELLEDALLDLKTLIHAQYPQIQRLWLKLSKPDILPHCNVALSNTWKFKS